MHVERVRTLTLLLLSSIIALNMVTSDSFACSLVGRADIATKPSFLLEMEIGKQITDLAALQHDISQAFKFVKKAALDISSTVRDNRKDIPYYAEAEWSTGKINYNLLIYYFDKEKQLTPASAINTELVASIKINTISFNVVGLESDCSISPAPSKFISVMSSLETPTIDVVGKYIDAQERLESISLQMIDDVTGKLIINSDSGSIEEIIYGHYIEPSMLFSNMPYLSALILIVGIIALVIYIKRGRGR